MRLLVTGGCGFLGSWVVQTALDRQHEVLIGCLNDREREDYAGGGTPLLCDVTSEQSVMAALKAAGCEAIVHCAAYGVDFRQQDPLVAAAVNVMGTLRLQALAGKAGVRRFVHVGTSYEYGEAEGLIGEETPLRPKGIYGGAKAAATLMLAQQPHEPAWTVLRPFGMYGPGEGAHKLVPQVVEACRTRTPLDLTEGGEVRDYLFVGDVARALVGVAEQEGERFPRGKVFNQASGEPVTIRELVTRVAQQLDGLELMRFGALPSRTDAPARIVGDRRRWVEYLDKSGLEQDLGILSTIEDVVELFAGEGA